MSPQERVSWGVEGCRGAHKKYGLTALILHCEREILPYYIPIENRNTYLRFREALEDSESQNIDEFMNELLDLLEDQDKNI